MAIANYIQKTLVMKPEVTKIFDDLEDWLDYCRFNLLPFEPKDLYKSKAYKDRQHEKSKVSRYTRRDNRPQQYNQ